MAITSVDYLMDRTYKILQIYKRGCTCGFIFIIAIFPYILIEKDRRRMTQTSIIIYDIYDITCFNVTHILEKFVVKLFVTNYSINPPFLILIFDININTHYLVEYLQYPIMKCSMKYEMNTLNKHY